MNSTAAVTTKPTPNHLDHHRHSKLLVDFPARSRRRCQAEKQVRFASHVMVQPVTSLLTMCSKQELWYSKSDEDNMRCMMKRDAFDLAQKLLFPSAKDLEEGISISQAVGLDKHVNPIQRRRAQKAMILQKHAVVHLQDKVHDEYELRHMSERFSGTSSVRARILAVHWMVMDDR
ncbi:hypothetical protein ACHAXM_004470 [Skeletonema potamos]